MPIHTSSDDIKGDILMDLYVNQGCPQKVVADIFGVCVKTLRKELVELGILRSRSDSTKLSWEYGTKSYNFNSIKRGKEAFNWKGGRHYDSRGYVLIYVGRNGRYNGIYDYEHVLVWEKYYGKKLPSNFIIHHLNGIRDDNRIENLFAVSRTRHIREFPNTYIRELQKRIKELEDKLKECA